MYTLYFTLNGKNQSQQCETLGDTYRLMDNVTDLGGEIQDAVDSKGKVWRVEKRWNFGKQISFLVPEESTL